MLAHPSVHLVLSHCGMASAQEALVFHKPLLCLPFFSDQHDVSIRVVNAGAGLSLLPKDSLTADNVRSAISSLLANHSAFSEKAAVLGAHLRAAGGVKAAGDALEQTLRLGGSDHLRPFDLDVPWHRAAMADVYVVYSALIALVAGLLVLLASAASLAFETMTLRWRERRGTQNQGEGKGGSRNNSHGSGGYASNGHGNGNGNGRQMDGPSHPPGSDGNQNGRLPPSGGGSGNRSSNSTSIHTRAAAASSQQRAANSNSSSNSNANARGQLHGNGVWPEVPLSSLGLGGSGFSGKPRAPFFDLGANLGLEDLLPTASGKEAGQGKVGHRRGRGEEWVHREEGPLFDRCVEASR